MGKGYDLSGLSPRSAIGSGPQILDGDDVQRSERHDLTIAARHSKRARSNEDHLGVADGVFTAVRGSQRKRAEPATRETLANTVQVQA